MKKNIVFMLINMNVGGTEKALLNMISEIPKSEYDITILMLEKYGGFLNSIPSEVNVEYVKEYCELKEVLNRPPKEVALNLLKRGKICGTIGLLFTQLLSKFLKNRSIFFKYVLKNVPGLKSEYDIAVAYAGPMDFISYFVIHKIKAKKKVQWIHFDVSKIGFNINFAVKIYKYFDRIYVVSDEARKKLIKLAPSTKEKSEVFLNVVSSNIIKKQSLEGEGFRDNYEGHRILTVGRLANEKGQDIAIRVLARLVKEGYKVKWYCLGEGSSRTEYERLIKEYNVQDKFILLGSNPNPYPYMDQCDIYVQPSRYEGYCITLAEARALQKPIITTNFTGAKEQIKNEITGIIVDIQEEQIYFAIKKLLNNPRQSTVFYFNLSKEIFKDINQMEKIYHLV
ncbi:glycosyl transferase [Virgibacillus phasianinus]|uniref:Glycosyl transferase n=1 Tax=Virgibacillus phasianinus TaxID=2017483 RepID=A0A220U8N0_9BACI|nr:glycosyltransferase [Virgibacillus phasianinus]ASK64450.1 glycosyl transferase [Virgibacillus phasianinus]